MVAFSAVGAIVPSVIDVSPSFAADIVDLAVKGENNPRRCSSSISPGRGIESISTNRVEKGPDLCWVDKKLRGNRQDRGMSAGDAAKPSGSEQLRDSHCGAERDSSRKSLSLALLCHARAILGMPGTTPKASVRQSGSHHNLMKYEAWRPPRGLLTFLI
jgi:hypothetical protein